jgi:hypothetical protein
LFGKEQYALDPGSPLEPIREKKNGQYETHIHLRAIILLSAKTDHRRENTDWNLKAKIVA